MQGNDVITTWESVRRLARKMSRPGVLRSFIGSRRLTPETVDSMGLRLEEAAATWPDNPAIKFEDRILTWPQANTRVNQYTHALADRGIAKGDVVVVNVTNRPEMLLSLMALMKLGAIAALINTGLRGESLDHSMRVMDPRAAILGEEQFDTIETVSSPETITDTWLWCADTGDVAAPDGWTDLAHIAAEAPTSNPAVTQEITLGDTAGYIYTSGTTGLPKAAVTGHLRARIGGLLPGRALLELRPEDTLYNALPLYEKCHEAAWYLTIERE